MDMDQVNIRKNHIIRQILCKGMVQYEEFLQLFETKPHWAIQGLNGIEVKDLRNGLVKINSEEFINRIKLSKNESAQLNAKYAIEDFGKAILEAFPIEKWVNFISKYAR